jgi:hypothetical protein
MNYFELFSVSASIFGAIALLRESTNFLNGGYPKLIGKFRIAWCIFLALLLVLWTGLSILVLVEMMKVPVPVIAAILLLSIVAIPRFFRGHFNHSEDQILIKAILITPVIGLAFLIWFKHKHVNSGVN